MQPSSWTQIRRIAGKETTLFFTSPVAYLFLAAFVSVSFFAVFWGEAFFARNLADARPLFEWMPILLLFLCSALTMKLWSEERRTGTLEHVLTTPVPIWRFVIGKFLACLVLLAAALALTTPFPLTVAFLGDLDWGPVVAGYLATFMLGAGYLSIGLFVSSRTSNQIISLLGSVAISGTLYLIGSPGFVEFFDQGSADWLQLMGIGARFESITRGVVELGSITYYLGLVLVFCSLNAFVLEAERWSHQRSSARRGDWRVIVSLIIANAIGLNLWVGQLNVRLDVTEGGQYSLSEATRNQLKSLQEPLRISAYFSKKTHPLLAPLVPQLKDLLKEYQEVSQGKVQVRIIDPQEDPEAEQQAREEFGVEPTPFQVSDRYEASIVSSYFNIVLSYGDTHETLGFQDLIEVKAHAMNNIDVELRNPEYDITRAIKKVVDSYQQEGNLFQLISEPVTLQLLVSPEEKLPKALADYRQAVLECAEKLKEESQGKLTLEVLDPQSDPAGQKLAAEYGFQPMAGSLFDSNRFFFYTVIKQGDKPLQLPLGELSKAEFEKNLKSALKRLGNGFTKTVAMVSGAQHNQLKKYLSQELNVEDENLNDGSVSAAADVLMLLSPDSLSEQAVYAVDQFLMRGGTVVVATSPYRADMSSQSLRVSQSSSGLEEWLKHHGVETESTLVLDPQCAAIPVPVSRYVQGHRIQTVQMMSYPYFIDVREGSGFADNIGLFGDISQLILPWSSPLKLNKAEGDPREFVELLKSSSGSWTNNSTDVTPQVEQGRPSNLTPTGQQEPRTLGVLIQGTFQSYFQDAERAEKLTDVAHASISQSPDSARLIVLSAPGMFTDQVIALMNNLGAGDPLTNLSLMANTIDWATQDESLLSIRSRSHFKRTLYPLERRQQTLWEVLNYALAFFLLLVVGVVARSRFNRKLRSYEELLQS